ncbi:hypothetical protein [Streptosporangium subroseum]|uniref:hypothetical protein n=1 Tax=Streptosporangium subroseum TaxID=106412 RepID=UPI00117E869B|nr:hypothetical protein [Streptosporangium subroseum]
MAVVVAPVEVAVVALADVGAEAVEAAAGADVELPLAVTAGGEAAGVPAAVVVVAEVDVGVLAVTVVVAGLDVEVVATA